MDRKRELQEIPLFDLNLSAFLAMNGVMPSFVKQGNKVICLFLPDENFYHYSNLYHSNTQVNILDFDGALRQLRSKVMTLRDEGANGGGSSAAK